MTLWGTAESRLPYPTKIDMMLQANWGHAPAQQLKRVLPDSAGKTIGLADHVDEAAHQPEVRRASEKVAYIPIAGASTVSADLLALGTRLRRAQRIVTPKTL